MEASDICASLLHNADQIAVQYRRDGVRSKTPAASGKLTTLQFAVAAPNNACR